MIRVIRITRTLSLDTLRFVDRNALTTAQSKIYYLSRLLRAGTWAAYAMLV